MKNVEQQLLEIESQLAEATREQGLISARISGLHAHRDALKQLLDQQASQEAAGLSHPSLSAVGKSDAIVSVLRAAGRPLAIREIVTALHEAGRMSENYNGVSVYLQTLLSEGRVRRPERGRYVADWATDVGRTT